MVYPVKRVFILLFLCSASLVFTYGTKIQAQQSMPSKFGIYDTPYLEGQEGEDEESYLPTGSDPLYPWSKIAFQSYRDGNWNIFVAKEGGLNTTRLTNSSVSEIHPHLNRGNTQVVFAKKFSDYEIVKMNIDGSNQTTLTANSADDGYPMWSPDGSKILFESYRDGQAEVYVMNEDGSGQRRLTNHGAFDGMPTWSPDGSQIAFVSNRSGDYRIWVMNADGLNAIRLSNQPFSLRPQWSPDGTRIAYDADNDKDGWQELWVMNTDGSNAQKFVDPSGTRDAWAGGWSPDGRFVAYTQISFTQYQGVWYWDEALLYGKDTLHEYGTRQLSDEKLDWTPRWQSSDAQPPSSQILNLPTYTSATYPGVGWSGYDNGESGLGGANIQYRRGNNGAWQDLYTGSLDGVEFSPMTTGELFQFRVRAHDNAYNWESWPGTAETETIFYDWSFSGTVTDNRGIPLDNKDIHIFPSTITTVQTDNSGFYQGYTTSSQPHTLSISNPQYGQFEETTIKAWVSQDQAFYLTPKDNLISNGSFEADAEAPTGWMINGNLTSDVHINAAVSGENGYSMGATCSKPICLSTNESFELGENISFGSHDKIAVVIDKFGTLHGVFGKGSNSNLKIYYVTRSASGSWSTPEIIKQSNTSLKGNRAFLQADSQGTLHVVWLDTNGIKHIQKPQNGNWSPVKVIRNDYEYMYIADYEIGPDDGLHILIRGSKRLTYLERQTNGQWHNPVEVWDEMVNTPFMAIGPDNALHFAWQKTYSKDPAGDHLQFYRVRTPEGIWLEREILHDRTDAVSDDVVGLEVDDLGRVHYLYEDDNIYHTIRNTQGVWSEPTRLHYASSPFVKIDSNGNLYLIDSYSGLIGKYRFYSRKNGWSAVKQIPMSGNFLSIVAFEIDANNLFHFIYREQGSMFYRQTKPAGSANSVSISQEITIPADMTAPTLSFLASASRDEPIDDTGLNIEITDSNGTTSVFSQVINNEWNHYWVDLEPWLGKEITVAFSLEQAADAPEMQLFLDDISLGSAYSDIWVKAEGLDIAQPGSDIVYEVSYGNQGGVDAKDIFLTLSLPPELSFVSSSIAPASAESLSWNIGDLAAGSDTSSFTVIARVGNNADRKITVMPQFEVSMSDEELEIENNVYAIPLFIGERVYLPRVIR